MSASPPKLFATPHGTMTIRNLMSMKIVDKYSCYVVGVYPEIADKKILSQIEYFGQFGDITSIRVIRHKNPIEAYIRFSSELSAIQAIKWCNVKRQFRARHGYKKYCLRFLSGKRCKKKACSNKHEWCNENDVIIIKNKQYKVFQEGELVQNAMDLDNNNNNINNDMKRSDDDELTKDEEINILQQQYMYLQCQCGQQNELISLFLHQIKVLQSKNKTLKSENKAIKSTNDELMAVLDTDHDYEQSVYHIVDAVIKNEVDSDPNFS